MKSFHLALVLLLSVNCRADVIYTTEAPRVSAKGRLQTTTGKRGDSVIHKIIRIDRGNVGTFREFIEDFYVDGTVVLSLSELKGNYMVDCHDLGTGVISLYFPAGSHRPEKILAGRDQATSESLHCHGRRNPHRGE